VFKAGTTSEDLGVRKASRGGPYTLGSNRLQLALFMRVTFILLLFLLTEALSFTGEVFGVLDRDTVEVLNNKKTQWIPLYRIDCREAAQRRQGEASDLRARLTTKGYS
jgi:hypothetical protein